MRLPRTLRISDFGFRIFGFQSAIRNPQSAFSLVELVISLGILSVGLVGAMRVFPIGLQASARSRMSSRATMAAQRILESLKLRSCEDLTQDTTTVEEFTVTTRLGQPDLAHLVDPARLKTLEAVVAWTQEGRPRALTFVTYIRCESE